MSLLDVNRLLIRTQIRTYAVICRSAVPLCDVSVHFTRLVNVTEPCSYMLGLGMICEGLTSAGTSCFCGPPPFSPAEHRAQTVTKLKQSRCRCPRRVRSLTLQPALRGHKNVYVVAARGSDPFAAAGSRLQNLLSGVG